MTEKVIQARVKGDGSFTHPWVRYPSMTIEQAATRACIDQGIPAATVQLKWEDQKTASWEVKVRSKRIYYVEDLRGGE